MVVGVGTTATAPQSHCSGVAFSRSKAAREGHERHHHTAAIALQVSNRRQPLRSPDAGVIGTLWAVGRSSRWGRVVAGPLEVAVVQCVSNAVHSCSRHST